MPLSSLAVAFIAIFPNTVSASPGTIINTVGKLSTITLSIVTVICDTVACEIASVALNFIVWLPFEYFVVSKIYSYGAVVSIYLITLSTKNATEFTPLSSLAVPMTVTLPDSTVLSTGAIIDTTGGLSNAALFTLTEICAIAVCEIVSIATNFIKCAPFMYLVVSKLYVYGGVVSVFFRTLST